MDNTITAHKVDEEILKSSSEIFEHLRKFSHTDQVEIFMRIRDLLLEQRELDFHRLEEERNKLEMDIANLCKGSEVIKK